MGTSPRTRVAALLTALAFTLISCTAEDTAGPRQPDTPRATDVQSPPSPTSFESERHSYHLKAPPGWEVAEYGGTWTNFKQFSPGSEVPGEDVLSSPDGQGFLVANSMAIPNGMRPADWVSELQRLVRSGRDPLCRETIREDVVAGERAMIVEHRCTDMDVVGRSVTHGGRGYYFTIGFPAGDSTTAATLEGIVSSIRFVDR